MTKNLLFNFFSILAFFFFFDIYISEFFVFCDASVDGTSSFSDVDSKLQNRPISNVEFIAIITFTHVVVPIAALYFAQDFCLALGGYDPLTTSALITFYSTSLCIILCEMV